jgi:hypothetical protein
MDMKDLFHYTDTVGYEGIIRDGRIRASKGERAKFGKGVYLTASEPNQERSKTAKYIFGRGGSTLHGQGRLDHYIRVKLPLTDPLLCQVLQRDGTWLYKADMLSLDAYDWDGGENRNWKAAVGIGLLGAVVVGLAGMALMAFTKDSSEKEIEEDVSATSGSDVTRAADNRCSMDDNPAGAKFQRVLDRFRSQHHDPIQRIDALRVLAPDCNGNSAIWCTLCFRQACIHTDSTYSGGPLDEHLIISHLQEHIDEPCHQSNIPGGRMEHKFKALIEEEYGKEAAPLYFKLNRIIISYQNAHPRQRWVTRLRVDKREINDSIGVTVLCTRCDIFASSIFWSKDGADAINASEVFDMIDKHPNQHLRNMHS